MSGAAMRGGPSRSWILPAGMPSSRACRDETEALTYASTVRQHIYWLSEEKLREYYRLPEPGNG